MPRMRCAVTIQATSAAASSAATRAGRRTTESTVAVFRSWKPRNSASPRQGDASSPRTDDGRAVVSTPDPADAPSQRSRLDDARDHARRAGDWANEQIPGAPLLGVALERERIAAAGLIAGGLAYRLFFWLVPLGLVMAAVLSFWVDADRISAADAARDFGMSGAAVQSAMNAIAEQHHARWYFLLAGSPSSSGSGAASSGPCSWPTTSRGVCARRSFAGRCSPASSSPQSSCCWSPCPCRRSCCARNSATPDSG